MASAEPQSDAVSTFGHQVGSLLLLTLDQSVQTQTPQLIRQAALGPLTGIISQERSKMLPKIAAAKATRQQTKQQQYGEQRPAPAGRQISRQKPAGCPPSKARSLHETALRISQRLGWSFGRPGDVGWW